MWKIGKLPHVNSMTRIFLPCRRTSLTLICLFLVTGRMGWSQTSWEVKPYEISVMISLAPIPELTEALSTEIGASVLQQCATLVGPAWHVKTARVPGDLAYDCIHRFEQITVARLLKTHPDLFKCDKVFFLSIGRSWNGFRVVVHELDCNTHCWGGIVRQDVAQISNLSPISVSGILRAFSPLAEIGKPVMEVDEEGNFKRTPRFVARLRAGKLVVGEDSPVLVGPGTVLRPILSRNDRLGRPKPGGVRPIPWTYLSVLSREGGKLDCQVFSGARSPISPRNSRRTERFALAIKRRHKSTILELRARENPDKVLIGYDVFSRPPTKDTSIPSQYLGRTDYRGKITIAPAENVLRLVYIKNGRELLARLPVVPGLEVETTVSLIDDDQRLEAEGFVRGMQQRLVDLVVERKILAVRTRQRIKDGKFDEAKDLIDELRSLQSPLDLSMRLDRQRQLFATSNKRAEKQINVLFADTMKLLRDSAETKVVEQLSGELASARQEQ